MIFVSLENVHRMESTEHVCCALSPSLSVESAQMILISLSLSLSDDTFETFPLSSTSVPFCSLEVLLYKRQTLGECRGRDAKRRGKIHIEWRRNQRGTNPLLSSPFVSLFSLSLLLLWPEPNESRETESLSSVLGRLKEERPKEERNVRLEDKGRKKEKMTAIRE